MKKAIFEKFREALVSIVPLTVLIVGITACFLFAGIDSYTVDGVLNEINGYTVSLFLIGALLLVVGTTLFALGSDIAMTPIGESIGAMLAKIKTKSKTARILTALAVSFVIGCVITIAEPDLQVLAEQTGSPLLIYIIAAGVGLFLAIAVMRIFFKWKLRTLLLGFYILVFALAVALQFVNLEFLAISFDSGGVTTGPITVPFLLAFGIGIATARSSKNSEDDSFGTVALCSIGPILAVMVMGLIQGPGSLHAETYSGTPASFGEILVRFGRGFLGYMGAEGYESGYLFKVAFALAPIVAVFFFFQIVSFKLPKSQILRITVGILYTYFGLAVFLTGVDVGFLPLGRLLGGLIASQSYAPILIPIGIAMGALVVLAEPAIHVLNKQVEEVTSGAISKKLMMVSLCVGVSLAVGLSMLRVVTGLSIWWIIVPAYAISLLLMFFVPPVFTGIAFDSGGVASGPMTATFMLPFAVGATAALGGDIFADAFGLVAFVAMAPLVTVQLVGLIFKLKTKRISRRALRAALREGAKELALDIPQTAESDGLYETTGSDIDSVVNFDDEPDADAR